MFLQREDLFLFVGLMLSTNTKFVRLPNKEENGGYASTRSLESPTKKGPSVDLGIAEFMLSQTEISSVEVSATIISQACPILTCRGFVCRRCQSASV